MNKKESAQVLTILASNFPYYYKNLNKGESNVVIETWRKSFEDVPAVIVLEAVVNCMGTSKYPPTIAEVNENITTMFFYASSVENDMRCAQEERSEAARLKQLLSDLGFDTRGRKTCPRRSPIQNLIGGSNKWIEE